MRARVLALVGRLRDAGVDVSVAEAPDEGQHAGPHARVLAGQICSSNRSRNIHGMNEKKA